MHYELRCDACGAPLDAARLWVLCEHCNGLVHMSYPAKRWAPQEGERSIWRYSSLLPLPEGATPVTLGEGQTPLIESRVDLGCRLLWKDETGNPSGSMKDRAQSVAMTVGQHHGVRRSIIASAGSAGLSAAVYAARAGIQNTVLLPQGMPAARKLPLTQTGSTVLEVGGELDRLIDDLHGTSKALGLYHVSTCRSGNPYQFEGPKTIAYELYEQLGGVPDWVAAPIGGGGTLAGIWRGFLDLQELGLIDRLPRLAGVQPTGFDALTRAQATDGDWRAIGEAMPYPAGSDEEALCAKLTHTVPPDGDDVWGAVMASGGVFPSASGAEALAAQGEISAADGLFPETSSTLVLPGLRQLVAQGEIKKNETVVALLTGSGFRELAVLEQYATPPTVLLEVDAVSDWLAAQGEA